MLHTRFALRRPVTTLMTFVAVSLIGLISTWMLPLELFPDIRFPGLLVNIPYDAPRRGGDCHAFRHQGDPLDLVGERLGDRRAVRMGP
jgi:hypothetical protein